MTLELIYSALLTLLSPEHFFYLCVGVFLGLTVGILPGLGGVAGLSIVLPFTFGMEPSLALAMMIGLIVPTTISDTFVSILMGIPGSSASQATVLDGFPLAKKGEGSRALSASFIASMIGGLIGALVLSVSVAFSRPIILAFGFGELLMLVVFSLSMVGMLTGKSGLKGIAACALGLLIGSIGAAPATGEYRMTFGQLYLADGLSIIIVGLGMFAVPEIIDLLRRESTIANQGLTRNGWMQGFTDVMRNKWVLVRCSLIGCLMGALPGVSGSVIDWIAYGHVVQTSRDRSQYGKGDIRGVIAVESANNSKDGGSLVPTLLFGIPGSGTMAVLLGGFMIIGIQPGPAMVTQHLDLTFLMIWSLALANVIGAGVAFLAAPQISKLTTIKYTLLGPLMIVLIFFAAFQASRDFTDMIALFTAGVLGVLMKRFGWPRPALLIGFVLAPGLEASVYQAIQVYGLRFFERPLVQVILVITIISIVAAFLTRKSSVDTEQMVGVDAEHDMSAVVRRRLPQIAGTLVIIAIAAVALYDSAGRAHLSRMFPMIVGSVVVVMSLAVLALQAFGKEGMTVFHDSGNSTHLKRSNVHYLIWIVGYLAAVLAIGFPLASTAFVLIFTTIKAGWNPIRNGLLAAGTLGLMIAVSINLGLTFPSGVLQRVLPMPTWIGGL